MKRLKILCLAVCSFFSNANDTEIEVYRLLNEAKDVSWIGPWANHTGKYDTIVGYSVLGAIFLYAPESREYLVLYPLKHGNNAKNYGAFESLAAFEQTILKDEHFAESSLHPVSIEELQELNQRLGALKHDEVYYPVPYPSIGGTWDIDTFSKGNVWVFADLAGQLRGLK